MFDWLFEVYYDASNYEDNAGRGYGKSKPNKTIGLPDGSFPIYIKNKNDDIDDLEDVDVDAINMSRKIGPTIAQRSDTGHKRVDRASFVSNSRLSLAEDNISNNPVRKGMSPYRIKSLDGAPIGTGKVRLTTGPARKQGTQYGTSRAPIDIGENPLLFGDKPVDKSELSFLKQFHQHQQKIKEFDKSITDLENN
jgi:hypothetical protein